MNSLKKPYILCNALHNRSSCKAFTLIETVIAMGLLSLVLVGAFSLLVGSYSTMRRTEETLYVNRLLETALEMTRNLSFADINGDIDGDPVGYAAISPLSFNTGSTLLQDKNGVVLYGKGVADASDPAASMELQAATGRIDFQKLNDDLYKVTATVAWTPFRLPSTRKSITTYIARQGINRQ